MGEVCSMLQRELESNLQAEQPATKVKEVLFEESVQDGLQSLVEDANVACSVEGRSSSQVVDNLVPSFPLRTSFLELQERSEPSFLNNFIIYLGNIGQTFSVFLEPRSLVISLISYRGRFASSGRYFPSHAEGLSVGIAITRRKDVQHISFYSYNHQVEFWVIMMNAVKHWILCIIYANTCFRQMRQLWDMGATYIPLGCLMLLIRDSNVIYSSHERKGGKHFRENREILEFQEFINSRKIALQSMGTSEI